jgi:hypothetical protein
MDALIAWVSHWLPLIQGFAALASIAGALLSWKYALKAERAREEMLRNAISSRLAATLERSLSELQTFRASAIDPSGSPDEAQYKQHAQRLKQLLEGTLAEVVAAKSFAQVRPDIWSAFIDKLTDSSANPDPRKIEWVCKYMHMVVAEIGIHVTKRQLSPSA